MDLPGHKLAQASRIGSDDANGAQFARLQFDSMVEDGSSSMARPEPPDDQPPPSLRELVDANSAVMADMRLQISRIEMVEDRMFGGRLRAGASGTGLQAEKTESTLAVQLWRQNTKLFELRERLRHLAEGMERAH